MHHEDIESATLIEPVEQLEKLRHEAERELLAIQARTESMRLRATILIGAAAILTATPDKWVSSWQIIPVGIGVAAAVLGLLALQPKRIQAVDITYDVDTRLRADPYSVAHNLFTGLRTELASVKDVSEQVSNYLTIGFLLLVLSWVASAIILFLKFIALI